MRKGITESQKWQPGTWIQMLEWVNNLKKTLLSSVSCSSKSQMILAVHPYLLAGTYMVPVHSKTLGKWQLVKVPPSKENLVIGLRWSCQHSCPSSDLSLWWCLCSSSCHRNWIFPPDSHPLCSVFGFPFFNEIRCAVRCAHFSPHEPAPPKSKQFKNCLVHHETSRCCGKPLASSFCHPEAALHLASAVMVWNEQFTSSNTWANFRFSDQAQENKVD